MPASAPPATRRWRWKSGATRRFWPPPSPVRPTRRRWPRRWPPPSPPDTWPARPAEFRSVSGRRPPAPNSDSLVVHFREEIGDPRRVVQLSFRGRLAFVFGGVQLRAGLTRWGRLVGCGPPRLARWSPDV